jgi:hypothetical protein
MWKAMGGPELVPQMKGLVPGRKFVIDFYHPGSKVAIELHGGVFMPYGRHTYGEGFQADRHKRDLLEEAGCKVYELVGQDINEAWIRRIMAKVKERERELLERAVPGSGQADGCVHKAPGVAEDIRRSPVPEP